MVSNNNNFKIKLGKQWNDRDDIPIQAHGGGILFYSGIYYWYGENKDAETKKNEKIKDYDCTRHDVIGVSCYSSQDLINWDNWGVVLPSVKNDPRHDIYISKVLERPKVVYNKKTRKFVMYMHIDNENYTYAAVGVAVSDSPTGIFSYINSFKPNGVDSRDMTIFQDDDGKAYLFHSSESNKTMYISPLRDDYLTTTGEYARIFVSMSREAPAIFKHKGLYYIITSGCTAWEPNAAEYASAENILGPWKIMDNPCVGENAEKTFYSQSTYVLQVDGIENAFIFMADVWKKDELRRSQYLWLPMKFSDGKIVIEWMDSWDLSVFDKKS